MNAIDYIFDETDWRPSFYGFFQSNFKQTRVLSVKRNIDLGIPCFVGHPHERRFGHRDNVCIVETRSLKSDPLNSDRSLNDLSIEQIQKIPVDDLYVYWSDDISSVVYKYHAMYAAIQIVLYMGFDEIYLVGCDLGFGKNDPHMIFEDGIDPLDCDNKLTLLRQASHNRVLTKSLVNMIVCDAMQFQIRNRRPYNLISKWLLRRWDWLSDENHFNDNYLPVPKDNSYANHEITKSHEVAKRIAADKDVTIRNATVGGELEVYPRASLSDVV